MTKTGQNSNRQSPSRSKQQRNAFGKIVVPNDFLNDTGGFISVIDVTFVNNIILIKESPPIMVLNAHPEVARSKGWFPYDRGSRIADDRRR